MQIPFLPGALEAGVRRRLSRLLSLGAVLVTGAALSPVRVGVTHGLSMMPTLTPGQPFLFRRISHADPAIRHGEVVVLRIGGQTCVKRVIACGGEHFWALGRPNDGLPQCRILTVNAPVSPWLRRFRWMRGRKVQVPKDHVFVLGDSALSQDSRHFGPVPVRDIVGRVILSDREAEDGAFLSAWSTPPPTPQELPNYIRRNGA